MIHIFMFLLMWSFAQSIMVDPGRVPEWVSAARGARTGLSRCRQYARLEMERQGMHIPGKLLSLPDDDVKK